MKFRMHWFCIEKLFNTQETLMKLAEAYLRLGYDRQELHYKLLGNYFKGYFKYFRR